MYQNILFPLLRRWDAERAHNGTLFWLEQAQRFPLGRLLLRLVAGSVPDQPIEVFGLTFPNPLGVAAGFDKDARVAQGLALLGFGHVETGTLTPEPQEGNPRPRVFRLPADGGLVNRMGFPNCGVAAAVPRLRTLRQRKFVLGVSLGKQKETPLEEAVTDYLTVMRAVYPYADYLAVNISSPNTPGLRQLQGGHYLEELLRYLQQENQTLAAAHAMDRRPLLVKIAPDLSWADLDEIVGIVQDYNISGVIATNTTLSRDGLTDEARHESGGVSGLPLRRRSTEIIAYIARRTGGKLPIIGVGGVRTAADMLAKLEAGASLVQLYTGLIYEGPRVARRILMGI